MFQLGCASRACFQNELLSGLTVALALVPEAVAFAFVAGVWPIKAGDLVEVNVLEDPHYHVADDQIA